MKFHMSHRDGAARIGNIMISEQQVTTPTIVFVETSRCRSPVFADIIVTKEPGKKPDGKPRLLLDQSLFTTALNPEEESVSSSLFFPSDVSAELHRYAYEYTKQHSTQPYCVIPANLECLDLFTNNNHVVLWIVAGARQAFLRVELFVFFLLKLREQVGYEKIVYLPSLGEPRNLALLSYMGVDLFDSMAAFLNARNNIFLFPTGNIQKDLLREVPCSCPACTTAHHDPQQMDSDDILLHNYSVMVQEICLIRHAILQGNLRDLVEQRVRSSPHQAAILRVLDAEKYSFFEERMPITRKTVLCATTKDALHRPEIRRFQERLLSRYAKPSSAKILLLLPCSARKPYSFSPSHRRFQSVLQQVENSACIHEVMVTSPLGLVPRELELVYPAARYDIAVTGVWDEDEKKMIQELLQQYLEKNRYDAVFIHLPKVMQEFLGEVLPDSTVTCVDDPSSEKSLQKLFSILSSFSSGKSVCDLRKRIIENLYSLALYQFDQKITDRLFSGVEVRGKYPFYKLMHHSRQLGMLTQERGLLSLTLEGAMHIGTWDHYWVDIFDDFPLKGSVFAPGVEHADPLIRVGDEVVIRRDHRVCGVGVAVMNGVEMVQLSHGEAVKLRHHC
ncbi:MAG: archaeosine synthase subunit alpha [Candidatus Thermoplasmatota archaeon]